MQKLIQTKSAISEQPIKQRIDWFLDTYAKLGKPITRAQAKHLMNSDAKAKIWVNNEYTVMHYEGRDADFAVVNRSLKGQCDYISIRNNTRTPCRNWEDFQRIKNQLVGPERWGIEIYPTDEMLVNDCHQYHIFVLPEGITQPFDIKGDYS